MPVLFLLHDATVVRTYMPFVERKYCLSLFETKRQRDACISMLSRGRDDPVEKVYIGCVGDLLVIAPQDHPLKSRFFYTCGVLNVMDCTMINEQIHFPQAYYFFPHQLGDFEVFNTRNYEVASLFDIAVPDFSMDDDVVDASSDDESEFDRVYMALYLKHCDLGKSMAVVDRMAQSRPEDSFIEWATSYLETV